MSRECEENNSNVKTLNERRMLFDKLIELDFDTIDKAPDFYVYSPCTINTPNKRLKCFIEIDFKEDLIEDSEKDSKDDKEETEKQTSSV